MRDLWQCRNIIIEHLTERGCTVSETELDFPTFQTTYPNAAVNPKLLDFECDSEEGRISVLFFYKEKLSKSAIEKILQEKQAQNMTRTIFITLDDLSPACKNVIKETKMIIEHFLISELQFNITKHILVSKHRIMIRSEVEELLRRLRTEKDKLACISSMDAMCKRIGARIGDVIEITRNSQTAGRTFYYRVVVAL